MTNELGGHLRQFRQRAKRSMEEAAVDLGITRNTLGGYERGERLPEIDFLIHFAQRFNAPVGKLVQLRMEAAGIYGIAVIEGPAPNVTGLQEDQARFAAAFDERLMFETIAAVAELTAELGLVLTADAKARTIIEIYKTQLSERANGRAGLSGAEIVRLVRRAS